MILLYTWPGCELVASACGRCPHWAGGRCRRVGSRYFSIAVIWDFSLWTAKRGGQSLHASGR